MAKKISMFARSFVPKLTRTPVVLPPWYNPGIYIKPVDVTWSLGFSGTAPNWTFGGTLINEITETGMEAVQGYKYPLLWGLFETDANTRDFSRVGAVLDAFAALTPQRRLILSCVQREFNSANGFTKLLPADLASSANNEGLYSWATGTAAGTISVREHKYAWPYKIGANAGTYGYNLKLWNSTDGNLVVTRFKAFIAKLIEYIRDHPNGHLVEHLGETESAIGSPVVASTYSTLDGSTARRTQQYSGKTNVSVYTAAQMIAIGKYHMTGINFDVSYVNQRAPLLPGIKSGFSCPDHHTGTSISHIFNYFLNGASSLSGQIPLAAECQADSYQSSIGIDTISGSRLWDFPTPLWLYNRAVTIGNTHFVIARVNVDTEPPAGTQDYWNVGYGSNGGMKDFLKTHPAIQNDALRAGGMVYTLPTALQGL